MRQPTPFFTNKQTPKWLKVLKQSLQSPKALADTGGANGDMDDTAHIILHQQAEAKETQVFKTISAK